MRPFFLLFFSTLLPVAVLFLTLKPEVLLLCLFVPPFVLPRQRLAFASTMRAVPLPLPLALWPLRAQDRPAPEHVRARRKRETRATAEGEERTRGQHLKKKKWKREQRDGSAAPRRRCNQA